MTNKPRAIASVYEDDMANAIYNDWHNRGWEFVCSTDLVDADPPFLFDRRSPGLTDRCRYCGRLHSAIAEICEGCGAPL